MVDSSTIRSCSLNRDCKSDAGRGALSQKIIIIFQQKDVSLVHSKCLLKWPFFKQSKFAVKLTEGDIIIVFTPITRPVIILKTKFIISNAKNLIIV